jgi:hypothetical protein
MSIAWEQEAEKNDDDGDHCQELKQGEAALRGDWEHVEISMIWGLPKPIKKSEICGVRISAGAGVIWEKKLRRSFSLKTAVERLQVSKIEWLVF